MADKTQVKPITYMKTHAADILATVSETHRPLLITHNGEAKMVIQDIDSYREMQETMAFLKLVATGRQAVERGKVKPAAKTFDSIERATKRRRRG